MGCCTWRICCQGSDDNAAESTVENGLNDEEALSAGMEAKAREFTESGAEVYSET